jgi:uncharacterized protein YdeI (YjbR/CyaY-like superfamily)
MKKGKVEAFYSQEGLFKKGLAQLRQIAGQTGLVEEFKWNSPVYTLGGKNVFGITAFSSHFGIWFFNGLYLRDPLKVLENAQEGKTKAMRHWKFTSAEEIDPKAVLAYMRDAVENQKKGKVWTPDKKKDAKPPDLLKAELEGDPGLRMAYELLSPYKRREFCEYIDTAKQEETKIKRLEKIIPMIREGVSLNDQYRKG